MVRIGADIDPDITSTAALIGDPSRARILAALADGRALPAGELARVARITPQTASAHLDKLFRGQLLAVEVQGRHHYYRLRDTYVAELLESLSRVALPAPALTTTQNDRARTLRFARTCYGHLAGQLGVAVTQALSAGNFLCNDDAGYHVTTKGEAWFGALGIELAALTQRPLTRRCLDWSERRHHLAGALGVALLKRMIELKWVARVRESRALRLSDRGRVALRSELRMEL